MIKGSKVMVKNEKLEEIIVGLKPEFPYSSIYVALNEYVGRCADWHWHSEFEFFFVLEGNVSYHLEDNIYDFTEGEGGFINSNVLHMTAPKIAGQPGTTNAQIMDKRFIAGNSDSIFESKYIDPIIHCNDLNIFRFEPGNEIHKSILHLLRQAYECEQTQSFGYELKIRNYLSEAWILFTQLTMDLWKNATLGKNLDSERIKNMLSYINHNYKNKVTLKDIAKSADISEREALRCFNRSVKLTPFEYLTNQRIQAASELLAGTDEQILMIGELCGFSTGSYFGKVFKEQTGFTPRAFRKKHR